MYLVTAKDGNTILEWDSEMDTMNNGYPRLVNKNIAFVPNGIIIYKNIDIPDDVQIGKHCYTETEGFYINPDYVEPNPYGIPDDILQKIKEDAIAEVQSEVTAAE